MDEQMRHKYMNDRYYLEYIQEIDLSAINLRMEEYAKNKNIILPLHKALKPHVALRVKALAQRSSCRLLAEICFQEEDPRHGLQMDGRDLKRWAAVVLGEIFTPQALRPDGEYWHEY